MVRYLLLALAGFAAADDDSLSLLQTSAVAHVHNHDSGSDLCRAARAQSRASKTAVKEARAALKAARAALKEAKATAKTDKDAVAEACPKKKVKGPKACSAKGFEEAQGYVNGQGHRVVLITPAERGRIGTYVYRGEWMQKTEGERQTEYHRAMCEAILPQYCGGEKCKSIVTPMDPTCEKIKGLPYNNCEPRGREGATSTADNNQYPPYMPTGHFAMCMDPICAKLCSDDPNCKSYEVRGSQTWCELNTGTANMMPHYGQYTDNYLVVQDGIYCEKK